MPSLEDFRDFLTNPGQFLGSLNERLNPETDEPAKDCTDSYVATGTEVTTYVPAPHEYEAIQYQSMGHVPDDYGNTAEVLLFLVTNKAVFGHCEHGHIFIDDHGQVSHLDDSDWILHRTVDGGHFFLVVKNSEFHTEFGKKFEPKLKSEQKRGFDISDNTGSNPVDDVQ